MQKHLKNLLWLLNGGIGQTIRQRNELKERLAVTQADLEVAKADLEKSRQREAFLAERLYQAAANYPLPFILLNALPKSGSTFLLESLRRGLMIPYKEISNGYFPLDVIDYRKIQEAAASYGIVRTHLDANPTNVKLLKKHVPRFILQLRDPRQALLSWVHHVKQYLQHNHEQLFTSITPVPPDSALTDSLSSVIDWHLTHFLPKTLEWTEQWLNHVESGEAPIVLLTQFKDFRDQPEKTIARILEFYEIPAWAYTPKEVPKDDSTHFRKGDLDEWREVFNPTQQKLCTEMMKGYPRVWRLYGGDLNSAAKLKQTFAQSPIRPAQAEYEVPSHRSRT